MNNVAFPDAYYQIIVVRCRFREFIITTFLLLLVYFHFAGGNDVSFKKIAIYVLLVLAALALILPVGAFWGGWGGLGWGGLGCGLGGCGLGGLGWGGLGCGFGGCGLGGFGGWGGLCC